MLENKNWLGSTFQDNLVSVIIPTYNREKFLVQSITSVFTQSYRPIECVVVDDGSTDNTKSLVIDLLEKLQSNNFVINYIAQENKGAPAARNTGLRNSLGEFIQFLDSDDLLYPEKIASQVEFLKKNPNIDGVFGDWNHGTEDNHKLIRGERQKDIISQFFGGRVIHTLSFLFRRGIVAKIGPWDIALRRNQEVDFNLRGVLVGGNFEYYPQTTGLWREHFGERIVSTSGAIKLLQFYDKWIVELEQKGLLNKKRKRMAAHFLFWYSKNIDKKQKDQAIKYLIKSNSLYPLMPEFNSKKMKVLKMLFGSKISIKLWYYYSQINKN